MNGFGFIEYKDAMDARDVVPGKSQPYCHLTLQVSQTPVLSSLDKDADLFLAFRKCFSWQCCSLKQMGCANCNSIAIHP